MRTDPDLGDLGTGGGPPPPPPPPGGARGGGGGGGGRPWSPASRTGRGRGGGWGRDGPPPGPCRSRAGRAPTRTPPATAPPSRHPLVARAKDARHLAFTTTLSLTERRRWPAPS